MTAVQFIYQYLQNEWSRDVDGRIVEVPEPTVVFENEDTQERLQYDDVIRVIDGGIQTIEPADVHYESENVDTLVSLDIRSTDKNRPNQHRAIGGPGRVRMFGFRDESTLEGEAMGGLTGETRRILQTIRRGTHEWDLVTTPEVNGISNQTGQGHYRAVLTLEMKEIAGEVYADAE